MRELVHTTLTEHHPAPVSWLWPGRIPRGKVTMLTGDPGLGKSFLTLDLAARVSSGRDFHDAPNPMPQGADVLLFSAEDDPADTIRPRLDAMGADDRRVHIVHGVRSRDEVSGSISVRGFTLDENIHDLDRLIEAFGNPTLVIIDPISAYMGGVDSHNNAQVREVLGRLSAFAGTCGTAVVCVSHLSKASQQVKAVYRQMGSLAFTAAARVVWQVSRLPGASEEEPRRAMLLVKSNLETRRTGLSFRVGDGRVVWGDAPLDLCADDADDREAADRRDAEEEARAFLSDALRDGPREAGALIREAETMGIALMTLKRAKKSLRVFASRAPTGGPTRPWVWQLEDHDPATGRDPLTEEDGLDAADDATGDAGGDE